MSEMQERVAKAIYAAFDEGGGYVGKYKFYDNCDTVLDGQFDLLAVARAAIEAMREPTERMIDAGQAVAYCEGVYRSMIDAALKGDE